MRRIAQIFRIMRILRYWVSKKHYTYNLTISEITIQLQYNTITQYQKCLSNFHYQWHCSVISINPFFFIHFLSRIFKLARHITGLQTLGMTLRNRCWVGGHYIKRNLTDIRDSILYEICIYIHVHMYVYMYIHDVSYYLPEQLFSFI